MPINPIRYGLYGLRLDVVYLLLLLANCSEGPLVDDATTYEDLSSLVAAQNHPTVRWIDYTPVDGPDICDTLFSSYRTNEYMILDINCDGIDDFVAVTDDGPSKSVVIGRSLPDTLHLDKLKFGYFSDCVALQAIRRDGCDKLIVAYPDPEGSYNVYDSTVGYNFRADTLEVIEGRITNYGFTTRSPRKLSSIEIVLEGTWKVGTDTLLIDVANQRVKVSFVKPGIQDTTLIGNIAYTHNSIQKIISISKTLNMDRMPSRYEAEWTDDMTVHTTLTYRNGDVNRVEDYGQIGPEDLKLIYSHTFRAIQYSLHPSMD